MMRTEPCKICETLAETVPLRSWLETYQKCPRCGEFYISLIYSNQMPLGEDFRAKLSGWVYEQNRVDKPPTLNWDVFDRVKAQPFPTCEERAECLLVEAVRTQKKLGEWVNVKDENEERFISATYSQDTDDVLFLLELLTKRGLMESAPTEKELCKVLPEGQVVAEELIRKTVNSTKGFVVMWAPVPSHAEHKSVGQSYDTGFQPGILRAGYDPVRIDRTEHINKIDRQIIAEIRSSAFVVADFTGHRGGVYLEAGFALGLGLPVIWTCREDSMDNLHFDIPQNCIVWEKEKPEDLANNLQRRIEAMFGKRPKTVS